MQTHFPREVQQGPSPQLGRMRSLGLPWVVRRGPWSRLNSWELPWSRSRHSAWGVPWSRGRLSAWGLPLPRGPWTSPSALLWGPYRRTWLPALAVRL